MPRFRYTCITASGAKESGSVDGSSRGEALRSLRRRGLRVIDLTEDSRRATTTKKDPSSGAAPARPTGSGDVLKEKYRLRFVQMMRRLLDGGLSAGEAVRSIEKTGGDPVLAAFASQVWQLLSDGGSFAEALRQARSGLAQDQIELLHAGETTGKIGPVMKDLERLIIDRKEVREELLAKLSYPAFLSVVAFLVCGFMVLVLIPQVENILHSLRVDMSLPMRILLTLSQSFFWLAPLVLLLAGGTIVSITLSRRTPKGRLWVDRQLWELPGFRLIVNPYLRYKICQTAASLLANGINLTETLALIARTIANRHIHRRFEILRQDVNDGESVTAAFREQDLLDPLSLGVLGTHESIGRLEAGFADLATEFRQQLDQNLSRLIKIVSGGALGLAFGLVTVIALAIVIALFEVARNLG